MVVILAVIVFLVWKNRYIGKCNFKYKDIQNNFQLWKLEYSDNTSSQYHNEILGTTIILGSISLYYIDEFFIAGMLLVCGLMFICNALWNDAVATKCYNRLKNLKYKERILQEK